MRQETENTNQENSAALTQIALSDWLERKNYFQFHGSQIYDKRRKILENAMFDKYEIVKYERLTDGKFLTTKISSSWTFVYNGKLYGFLTNHSGQISNYFELNTSKEKCVNSIFGVYYKFVLAF